MYTRTYETLPRGISRMLKKLDPSIYEGGHNFSGRRSRYIVAYNYKDVPRGILIWAHRCPRKFGRHNMQFLAIMDTSVHHRGYGEMLFRQFLSESGKRFFLLCLDDNAEGFWRYIAGKYDLAVTSPFKSPWGSPALMMQKPG